jgi:DnaJ-like protein
MILLALGVLGVAIFVGLGRRPLMATNFARPVTIGLAIAAAGVAAYDAARGGWLGGSILLTAALWLAVSSRPPRAPDNARMSRAEAASMLGVGPGAGREEIESAYRRLMMRVHPDHGGAAGLAAQLNAARTVLLTRT